jgi:hypothetical protein
MVFLKKNVYPSKKNARNYSIAISDNHQNLTNNYEAHLKIFLNLNIFKNLEFINEKDLFYPITMHPIFQNFNFEKKITFKTPNSCRKIAAIFIGNVDIDNNNSYNMKETKELFGINTRHEMFNAITTLPPDILYTPTSLSEFLHTFNSGSLIHKIVILNRTNFSIPPNLWFKILLESTFFIHMCGFIQPYCHNQTESMLAGCIPITQFNRFFLPHFENNKNALLFTTIEELISILKEISHGTYDSFIPEMRKNITAYYHANYSFLSFQEKLSFLLSNKINYTNYFIATSDENILNAV